MDEPWPEDAESEELVGDWRLWQRKKGHRTSTDDVVTAARAAELTAGAKVASYLDLGCGVGSVLLLTANTVRPFRSVGIEAQPVSAAMARRSVRELPTDLAIAIVEGDIRESDVGTFELITGSPPYFPVGTGVLPPDPQRQACRFELRGGVEAYAAAAARHLAPGGRFVMVAQTAMEPRVTAGANEVGLSIRSVLELKMRSDRAEPFLSVWELRWESGAIERRAMAIRDASGAITDAYAGRRAGIGLRRG